ncbi:GNAT family N-acetyltransferase [Saccharopolyspora rhizosphaerae]|uniref:GNAT family N-acetyltransferase n=1 Tax=Saccharopolyspora rhizosphaerae TaxID=2492662 RepID=A0A3R8P2Q0_9PSEU|nr:GNAT family N-acetyltransferase [Saccharopolyspora rhizosphaerae]RRO18749.1 GNAT family N-acetyltransferase [Saccharopolyspora rhizosphaerae]
MAELRSVHTADLDEACRRAARSLLWDVFAEEDPMTEEDWEHCLGGLHVLAWEGDRLVGHAALVMRRLLLGDRALRTGYVEGVAVSRDRQGQGVGGALMAEVERVVRAAYDLGALGASEVGRPFYAARGWKLWPAPTGVLTSTGVRPTPEADGWIFYYPVTAHLDLTGTLICEPRPGEAW